MDLQGYLRYAELSIYCYTERMEAGIVRILPWIFFLVLLLASIAEAGEPEIVVVGTGSASIDPDSAAINFEIRMSGETIEQAGIKCTRAYEQIVGALEGAGFSRRNIYTKSYSTDIRSDEKGRKIIGFFGKQSLYVSTKDLDNIGAIIDLISSSGVSTIHDIRYFSTKEDSIRRIALSSAVRNARKDAEAMAVAAEGDLGTLIELTTHYPDNPTYRTDTGGMACAAAFGVASSMSITPQPYSVRITVLGRWTLNKLGEGTQNPK